MCNISAPEENDFDRISDGLKTFKDNIREVTMASQVKHSWNRKWVKEVIIYAVVITLAIIVGFLIVGDLSTYIEFQRHPWFR